MKSNKGTSDLSPQRHRDTEEIIFDANKTKKSIFRGTRKFLLIGLLAIAFTGVIGLTQWGCGSKPTAVQTQVKKIQYTCPMHHQIRRDEPGDCPICGMTLVPIGEGITAAAQSQSGRPGSLKGLAVIQISPYQQQLIGVRMATVRKASLTRVIHTGGRFAGGDGDFAALAGDFAARNPAHSSGRFLVADIYALDLPFIKTGQKAVVTSLSGSGERVEGKITHIYPYDDTQSRVTRVKVALTKPMTAGLFANVDIEAVTEPRLCLPPASVMDTGTHRYVFIQTAPGTFSPREITVGYQGSDFWEVTSGLKEGDQVVDGANFLIDADSKITSSFAE
jgi:hypothetical protein